MLNIKALIPIFFIFLLVMPNLVVSADNVTQHQNYINSGIMGTDKISAISSENPVFSNSNVTFRLSNGSNLNFVFPFAVTYLKINDSYYKYSYSGGGLSVSFIFSYKESLDIWKLTINGTSLIFNGGIYFDWSDSPNFITYINKDNTKGVIRINIPKGNFNIDPYFGYKSSPTSSVAVDDTITGGNYTFTGGNGYVADNITVSLKYATTNSSWKIKCALYKQSDLSLVGETPEVEQYYTTTLTWYTFAFSSKPSLTNNTVYWIVIWVNNPSGTLYIGRNLEGNRNFGSNSTSYGANFPNPIGGFTSGTYYACIYCNYSVASGTNYEVSATGNIDIDGIKTINSTYIRTATGNINVTVSKLINSTYVRNIIGNIKINAIKVINSTYVRTISGNIDINSIINYNSSFIRQISSNLDITASMIRNATYSRLFEQFLNLTVSGEAILLFFGDILITIIYNPVMAKVFEYATNTFIANGTTVTLPYNSNLTIYTAPTNETLYQFESYLVNTSYSYENPYILVFNNNQTVSVSMLDLINQVSLGTELSFVILILLVVLIMALAFYKISVYKGFTFVTCIFGIFFSMYALAYPIPFYPFVQLMFIFIFILIIYYKRRT